MKMTESLTLKWGTLKDWSVESDRCLELLRKYEELGSCVSAALQEDTPEQKQIICELIDSVDCKKIENDWTGEFMTKEEAKRYVMEYDTNP
jgi:hypothetical protein